MLKRTKWNARRQRFERARDSYETKAEHLSAPELNIRIRILMAHAYDLGRRDQRAVTRKRFAIMIRRKPAKLGR
jgi:hypothetical protein